MKKFLIILTCILLYLPFYAQQSGKDYYYYFGEKIFLTERADKLFMKLAQDADKQNVTAMIMEEASVNTDSFSGNISGNIILLDAKEGETFSLGTLTKFKENPNVLSAHLILEYNDIMLGLLNHFTVKLKPATLMEQLQQLVSKYNCNIEEENPFVQNQYTVSLTHSSDLNAMQMANLFYETELFEFSEPNFGIFNSLYSNDPYFNQQWNLKNTGQLWGIRDVDIKAEPAWEIAHGGMVNVAVIDVGVDKLHPDLMPTVSSGYDATGNGSSGSPVSEYDSHGTLCAGIIGAKKDNKIGIAGVAPQCMIIPVKFGIMQDFFGIIFLYTETGWAANSIRWAYSAKGGKADILSNSWGGGNPDQDLTNAITEAVTLGRGGKGCVVVFASGNYYSGMSHTVFYPANLHNVISVGAIDRQGNRAGFSCYGDSLDVVAPGEDIWTTNWPNDESNSSGRIYDFASYLKEKEDEEEDYSIVDYIAKIDTPPNPPKPSYREVDGTSMACPHVAGIAALILSVNNNLYWWEVKDIIESTAQKEVGKLQNYLFQTTPGHPNGTWHEQVGYGLVDAHAALVKVLAMRCPQNMPAVQGAITKNTTWSAPVHVVHSIVIPNGVTLTVTSQVKCDNDVSITVQPGGKLIVNDGKLTNACEDELWKGIIVQGDGVNPLSTTYQGCVQINGGTIENAVCGIYSTLGGLIYVENAYFKNNTIAVQIDPVATAQRGTSATFKQTNFIFNDSYLNFGNTLDFETHIKLSGSKGVVVSGCTFSNEATQKSYQTGYNTGILCFNSPLTVRECCHPNSPVHYPSGWCINYDSSVFSGFNVAIYASNSGTAPAITVRNSDFISNLYGAKISAVNYHELLRNNFDLTQSNSKLKTYGYL
ncbi:MAG: S8 family serine peptidase [Bacteroidales bacterium]|jgi:subtilisin family serine protease|nr:S8 family serine peptidase [Bacteroidales bacterium]